MNPVTSGQDPTVPLEPFTNTTSATGGDSRLYNLNVFYSVSVALGHPSTRKKITYPTMVAAPKLLVGTRG